MVQIESDTPALLVKSTDIKILKTAKIELIKTLPKEMQGKVINAKVEEKLANGHYKLQLKNGKTIEAKITPAPKIGSQISFIALKNGDIKVTELLIEPSNNGKETNNKQTGNPSNNLSEQGKEMKDNGHKTVIKPQITDKTIQETATDIKQVHKQDPFKQLRQLIGQKVPLSLPKGQTLPNKNNVLTVVVSKPEKGLQTLQPQNNKPAPMTTQILTVKQTQNTSPTLPPFQAKFPTVIPEGTVIKMNITPTKGEILDITPPKEENIALEKQPLKPLPALSKSKEQTILLTSKISALEKPLPEGAKLTLKIITQATQQDNITTNKTLENGEIKTETVPQFKQIATTTGSTKLTIISQTSIPVGTEIDVKINKQGSLDIVKINKFTAIDNKQSPSQHIEIAIKSQSTPLKIGQTYNGTVVAKEASHDNQFIISLNNGKEISVKSSLSLPLGQQVSMTLLKNGITEIITIETPLETPKTIQLAELSSQWRTLKEGLNRLQLSHKNSAEQLKNNLPNFEKGTFLPNIISFIDAVNNQSMERLAGDKTVNLLKALGVDFTTDINSMHTVAQKNTEQTDNWRALLFPYVENENSDPKQGGFFWHNQENGQGNPENTRFIVHLELTSMGAVQVDGFIQNKDIQLKLKTQNSLNDVEKQGLKSVVRQTLETLNMTGDIHILNTPPSPEKPLSLIVKEDTQYKVTI